MNKTKTVFSRPHLFLYHDHFAYIGECNFVNFALKSFTLRCA